MQTKKVFKWACWIHYIISFYISCKYAEFFFCLAVNAYKLHHNDQLVQIYNSDIQFGVRFFNKQKKNY